MRRCLLAALLALAPALALAEASVSPPVTKPLWEKAVATPPPAKAAAEETGFVKGELSDLGATKLKTHDTRFGLRAGLSKIGEVYYAAAALELDLRLGDFQLGLAAPAQIPLWDPREGGTKGFLPNGLAPRAEDYASVSEIVRFLRYFTYGHKEDHLYIDVGTETTTTIGHGGSVRRYVANVDPDFAKVSAEVDAYGRYGGAELFVGDLFAPQDLLGGLAFLKPFGGSASLFLSRLSFGVTYAADFAAPYELKHTFDGWIDFTTGVDPLPIVAEARPAQVVGLSVESKLVKTASVDVKPYLEADQLVGGGAGLSLGTLGRFTFGEYIKHAFRLVGELRAFQGNYLPGYFDTFYGVQRYQYITGKADSRADDTKLYDVLHRAPDLKLGYYLEAQYSMVDWFAVTAAWEDSTAKGGRNLVLHAEIPATSFLKVFASVHRRSVEGGLFDLGTEPVSEQLAADNTLILAGARLEILPILYLNARYYRMWQVNLQHSSFENVDGFQLDVEVGYEFSRSPANE